MGSDAASITAGLGAICVQVEDHHASESIALRETHASAQRRVQFDRVGCARIQQHESDGRQRHIPDARQAVPVVAADVCGRRDEVAHGQMVSAEPSRVPFRSSGNARRTGRDRVVVRPLRRYIACRPHAGQVRSFGLPACNCCAGRLHLRAIGAAMPCTKIPYPSPRSALRVLGKLQRRRTGETRRERVVYPCEECHAFHLTSRKPRPNDRWAGSR